MSTHDEYLKKADSICQKELKSVIQKTEATIEPVVEQFQKNTLANIPQEFGNFLYTALGERVTGQRSSVLNKTYLENNERAKAIAKRAEENKLTLEEQVAKEQKEAESIPHYMRRRHGNHHDSPQLWISTGRKFGVSYITGDSGDRFHTIYFGEGECFTYLTQEHVDCVKNKLKRECVQQFLNFRNDFYNGTKELMNQLVKVDVPVKLGQVACVVKSPKVNRSANSYQDDTKKNYHLMDEIVDDRITHVLATIQNVNIWDKKSNIGGSARGSAVMCPSYVSLIFMKIDDNAKTIAIIGNADIGMKDFASSVQVAPKFEMRETIHNLQEAEIDVTSYRFSSHPALTGYGNYTLVDSGGVLLNMHEVLTDKNVKAELDKRVKFYNDMSDRLQRMKHDNATLYFVNADM